MIILVHMKNTQVSFGFFEYLIRIVPRRVACLTRLVMFTLLFRLLETLHCRLFVNMNSIEVALLNLIMNLRYEGMKIS